MAKNQRLEFVGIVENLGEMSSYYYCSLDIITGGMTGHKNVQSLGMSIAFQFGKNFQQKITYEPPLGVDIRGTEQGLVPRRYHRLSVLEQDRFEKSVLRELESKK